MNNSSKSDQKPFQGNRITRDHINTVFGPNIPPVLTAGRSETILFETVDCFGGSLAADDSTRTTEETARTNPVTGPVMIEGAEPGDVLCVHIQNVSVASTGISVLRPKTGLLGSEIRKPLVYQSSIQGDSVTVNKDFTLPLNPVVGIVGVVPRHGDIRADYPGRHGGNMDTQDLTVGSRVFLPVQVTGALLSIGAVKATMGDGESIGVGVEVAAEVTVRVDILPGGRFSWPRLETKENFVTIASASSVDQAAKLATMEMVRWLEQEKGLDFETAYLLVGLSGDLRISQWSNPLMTARMVLSRSIMNKIQGRASAGTRTIRMEVPEEFAHLEEESPAFVEDSGVDVDEPVAESAAESDGDSSGTDNEEKPSESTGRRSRYRRRRRPSGARRRKTEEGSSSDAPDQEKAESAGTPEGNDPTADTPASDSENADGGDAEKKEGSSERPRRRSRSRRPSSRRPRRRPAGADGDAAAEQGSSTDKADDVQSGSEKEESAAAEKPDTPPSPAGEKSDSGESPTVQKSSVGDGDAGGEDGEKIDSKQESPKRRRPAQRRPRSYGRRRRPASGDSINSDGGSRSTEDDDS